MKVMVLGDGSSIHTLLWLRSYLEGGFEVALFTLEEPSSHIPEGITVFHPDGIPSHKFKYLLKVGDLKKSINAFRPRILHAHMVPNYGTMAFFSGHPYVISPWGRDILWMKPSRSILYRNILRKALLIHADAYILKKVMVEKLDVNPQKIRIFPFGLTKEIRQMAPKGKGRGIFKIVEFRRHYDWIYNQSRLIEAVKILKERGIENFHLWMMSSGKDTDRYRKLVRKLDIEDLITITGGSSREAILNMLQKAHIYVSASLVDSTSVSLLEAMVMGALPVVSDIVPNHEWISHGFNGFLFSPHHPEDIADTLQKAMDMELIERAMPFNRSLIEEKASWERNFEGFANELKAI